MEHISEWREVWVIRTIPSSPICHEKNSLSYQNIRSCKTPSFLWKLLLYFLKCKLWGSSLRKLLLFEAPKIRSEYLCYRFPICWLGVTCLEGMTELNLNIKILFKGVWIQIIEYWKLTIFEVGVRPPILSSSAASMSGWAVTVFWRCHQIWCAQLT